jgi:hypothetical protein
VRVEKANPGQDPSAPSPRPPWDASALLALINGTLAGVASVYVTTQSLPITVIAGGSALLLAGLVLITRR